MPWKEIPTAVLAKQLGIDYAELKAKQDLIKKIRAAREKRNLTQAEFAKKIRKSQSWVAKVESGLGTKNVSFEVLFGMLTALGFSYRIAMRELPAASRKAA